MKKTKLLTSIAALALVLSLGACNQPEEETTSEETSEGETTDTESSSADTEVSTEGAYAIVGDFVDADWDNEPTTDSKYFIPAGTEEFKVTVTTASEPVDNEWWTEDNQWDAGLSVVEYGTWNRVIAFDELDSNSTGVGEAAGNDNNIVVTWGSTYNLVITLGDTPSILITEKAEGEVEGQYEDNTITEMLAEIEEGHNYYAESEFMFYQSDVVSNDDDAMENAEISLLQGFGNYLYATEDALLIQYINWTTYSYMDVELYVNNYETGKCDLYGIGYSSYTIYDLEYIDSYDGTWTDLIYSLVDLVDYSWAFSVADTESTGVYQYGDVEDYDVDEAALDMVLQTTVGNTYIWNNLFTNGDGWHYYMDDDAADMFGYAEYLSGGLYTGFNAILEIAFFSNNGWYWYDRSANTVIYQQIYAHTDVYTDKTGVTEIPQEYASYLA